MKEGWEYKKLGEVCKKITDGSHNPPKGIEHSEYRMISSQNIFDDEIRIDSDNVRYLTEKDFVTEDKRTTLCAGIVLLTIVGTIGRACVISGNEGKITLQRSVAALSPKDEVLPRYLMYCLIGKRCELNNESHGIAQKGIYLKQLSSLQIPLPPLSIQHSIVSELDEINNLLTLKRKELETYDKLAQSLFYEMFGDPVENEKGWEVKKFGEICDRISNGYNAKLEEDTYKSEGIMYFRCQNVWRNHFDYSDLVYIDEQTNQMMKSSSLKHNDFLITKIGRINTENSSLGRVSLYEGEDDKANLSGNLCFARLKNGCAIHRFILYILISNQFRDYIRRTTVGGIDKRALNVKQVSSFPIINPPLPLQQLFAQRIEAIEQQKSQVKAAIEKLETLLAARMQYWFE